MEEKICGTAITHCAFEKALRKYFGDQCPKLESLDAVQIACGEGFTSKIVRVLLKWEMHEGFKNLPESVIFKAPSAEAMDSLFKMFSSGGEQNGESMLKMITTAHEGELTAYKILGPLNVLPMPICFAAETYSASSPGFLVLEDLGPRAIISEKNDLPMTLEQLSNVVKLMTDFHAWSLSTNIPLSEHFYSIQNDRENVKTFLDSLKDGVISLKKEYPVELKEIDEDKVTKFFDIENYIMVFDNHVGIMDPVIVHGDFWSNNVMFKRNVIDGKASGEVCAIIDWQICCLGSCMADFGRLLAEFPDDFLNDHVDIILQKYCEDMKEKAGSKFTVSFEQVKKMFQQHLALNAMQYIAMGEITTSEDNKAGQKRKVDMAITNYKRAMKILKL